MSASATLTSGCSNVPDEKRILFPSDMDDALYPDEDRVRVWSDSEEKILRFSKRTDAGDFACVAPSVLAAFGSKGVTVNFEGISLAGRFKRDRMLSLQLVIAVLTWTGAFLSIAGTYIKSTGDTATPFEQHTAIVVLVIAAVVASFKLITEIQEA